MDTDTELFTVGLLLGQMEEDYVAAIVPGVEEYASRNNINLIIFDARFPASEDGYDFKYNVINNFISGHTVQGLVVIAGEMSDYLSYNEISEYCKQFIPIPVVTISYEIDGLMNTLVDNRSGIFEAVDHLCSHHKKRHIAFIKGPEDNPDAIARFKAYREAIESFGILFDEQLVLPGFYTIESGESAARELMNRNIDFDALIASDDTMAIGALSVLKKQGVSIPGNVAVIGFDDSRMSRFTTPELSSVHQPLKEAGFNSISRLHGYLKGEKVESGVVLPTRLIRRQSCGCQPEETFHSNRLLSTDIKKFERDGEVSRINEYLDEILYGEFCLLPDRKCHDPQIARSIAQSVTADYKDNKGVYNLIQTLNSICGATFTDGISTDSCREIVSILLRVLYKTDYFDSLFLRKLESQAELFFLRFKSREQSLLRIYENQKIENLYYAIEALGISFDFDEQRNRIESILPVFDINTCLIVLYEKSVGSTSVRKWQLPTMSKLKFCYYDQKRDLEMENGDFFATAEVIPPGPWKEKSQKTLLIMPLFFDHEQFGYLLFSFGKTPVMFYEVLRIQISNFLKGSILVKEKGEKEKELRKALSRLEDTNAQLHDLSHTDVLTGLFNRRGFIRSGHAMMTRSIKSNTPFLMFFADLDGLKEINDTFGHDSGDKAIRNAAEVMKKVFRDKDVVARLAGDEFTIIAWDADRNHIEAILDRIEKAVIESNEKNNEPFRLSMSVGYTIFTRERDISFDALMVEADKDLYRIKQEKKNRI